MDRIVSILAIVLLLTSVSPASPAPDSDFEVANRLYRAENFEEAVRIYQSILEAGFESGALHYNLGNAFFKCGELGKAILHYEKARRFLPRDRDLEANLQLARMRVADKIEVPRLALWKAFDRVRDYLSPDEWAVLTLTVFLLTLALFAVYYFLGRGILKKAVFYAALPPLFVFLFSALFFELNMWRAVHLRQAVIIQEKVEILSAPDQGAKALFSLHEGTTIRVEQNLPPWAEISLPDGKKGWASMDSFAEI